MAGTFDPNEYFKQRLADASLSQNPVQDQRDISARLYEKRQKLEEATRLKMQALQDSKAAYDASQTLTGKIATAGTDNEYLRQLSKGAVEGTALVADGLGGVLQTDAINGDALHQVAADIDEGVNTNFRAEMNASMPQGDIGDPSSWSLGDDPSLEGFMGNLTNVFGQMTPIILTGLVTRSSAAAGAVGALQAGAAGAKDAREYIDSLTDEQLASQVPLYAEEYAKAVGTPEQKALVAREAVAKQAAQTQAAVAGAIGGFGGAATARLLKPFSGALGKGVKGRVAAAGLTAAEEGTEEVLESVLGRAAVNADLGTDRDVDEGTFADAVLGAGASGGVTVAREVASLASGKTLKEHSEEKAVKAFDALNSARESGNVTEALDNSESKPTDVIKAAIAGYQAAKDPETKKERIKEVKQLRDQLPASEMEIEAAAYLLNNPVPLETLNSSIENATQDLKEATTPEDKEKLQARIERFNVMKQVVESGKYPNARAIANARKQFKDSEELIKQLNKVIALDTKESERAVKSTVQEQVSTALDETQPAEVKAKAAKEATVLLMQAPDSVSQVEIEQLAESPDITPEQKTWLRSLSQVNVANNKLQSIDGVDQDIFKQTRHNSFKSLPDHVNDVRSAARSGDIVGAEKELTKLRRFAISHSSKAAALQEAHQRAQGKQQALQVMPSNETGTLEWRVLEGTERVPEKEVRPAGGLIIRAGKNKLVDSVPLEADAIRKTLDMLANELALHKAAPVAENTGNEKEVAPGKSEEVINPEATQETQDGQGDPVVELENGDTPVTSEEEISSDVQQTVAQPEIENSEINEEVISETNSEVANQVTNEVTEEAETAYVTNPNRVDGHMDHATRTDPNTDLINAYTTVKKGHVNTNPNFLMEFMNDPVGHPRIQALLDPSPEIQEKQLRSLSRLAAFIQSHLTGIIDGFAEKEKAKDKFYNITQSLLTDGQLDPNAAAAIAVGIFETIAFKATNTAITPRDKILEKFGGETVNYWEEGFNLAIHKIQYGGTVRNQFIEELGSAIVDVMGRKAHKTAPKQVQENLRNELGAYATAYMKNVGLIKESFIPIKDLKKFGLDGNNNESDGGSMNFYRLAAETKSLKDRNFIPQIQNVVQDVRGARGITGKLFEVENAREWPTDTPPEDMSRRVKKSIMAVPKKMAEGGNKAQKQASFLRDDAVNPESGFLHLLPRRVLESAAGIVSEKGLIASKKDAVHGKNLGLRNELDNLFEFINSWDVNTPIYFKREFWVTQRMGLVSNLLNPLLYKTHRHVMMNEGGEYEVPTRSTTKEAAAKRKEFKLAVLEGLGVKVDKKSPAKALKQWKPTMDKPEIKGALAAIEKLLTGQEMTDADYTAIEKGVAAGGENFHSLDALWQWSRFKLEPGKTFKATLTREADGVNNGPFLSFIQAGILALENFAEWRKKGGFFTKEDIEELKAGDEEKEGEFGDWAEQETSQDLYETLAFKVSEALNISNLPPFWQGVIGDLTQPSGKVTTAARKLFKGPLTEITFGSSTNKAVTNMGSTLLDNWLDSVQELYSKIEATGGKDNVLKKELVDMLKQFETQVGVAPFDYKNLSDLERVELNPKAIQAFHRQFMKHFGGTTKNVIEDVLHPFTAVRDSVTGFTNVMAAVLNEVFLKKVEEAKEAAGIAKTEGGNYLDDLTGDQYNAIFREVMEMAPILATPGSKGGAISTGHLSAPLTSSRVPSGEMSPYRGSVPIDLKNLTRTVSKKDPKTGRILRGRNGAPLKETVQLGNIGYRGKRPEFDKAGARAYVGNVHATDSFIATSVYQNYNILNVHDAAIAIPSLLKEVMKKYNNTTMEAMIEHSIPEEVLVSAYRTYYNAMQYLEGSTSVSALGQLIGDQFEFLKQADANRLEFLSTIERVHQYAYSGAYHDVTEEQKARIRELQGQSFEGRIGKRLVREGVIPDTSVINTLLTLSQENQEQRLKPEISKEEKEGLVKAQEILSRFRQLYTRTGNLEHAYNKIVSKLFADNEASLEKKGIPLENFEADLQYAATIKDYLGKASLQLFTKHTNFPEHLSESLLIKLMDSRLRSKDVPTYIREDYQAFRDSLNEEGKAAALKPLMLDKIREAIGKNPNILYQLLQRQITDSNDPAIRGTLTPPPDVGAEIQQDIPLPTFSPSLVKALEAQPVYSFSQFEKHISTAIGEIENKDIRVQYHKLFKLIKAKTNRNLTLRYVTPSQNQEHVPEKWRNSTLYGLYNPVNKANPEILIFSGELSNKPVEVEVLLHELIHANTAWELANPTPTTSPVIDKLNGLFTEVSAFAEQQPELKKKHENAFTNLDEFISWGLTNAEFQRDVLTKVEVSTDTFKDGSGQIMSALRAFMNYLSELVLGNNAKSTVDALQALSVHGAALIEHATVQSNRVYNSKALPMAVNTAQFMEMSSSETLQALANSAGLSQTKTEHLHSVMDSLVTSVHGPLGNIIDRLRHQGKANPAEAFHQAILIGDMPLYNGINTSGLVMDEASQYVAEQVDLSIRAALDRTSLAYTRLENLFAEAKKKVSPKDFVKDWDRATESEKAEAKRIYRRIFFHSDNGVERRSGLLAQFAALSMTYEPLRTALDYSPENITPTAGTKLGERIKIWYDSLMRKFANFLFNNRSTATTNKQVMQLATSLVRREQLRQQKLAEKNNSVSKAMDYIDRSSRMVADKAIDALKSSDITAVRRTGKFLDLYHGDKLDEFSEQLQHFRQAKFKKSSGFFSKLLTEVRGDSPYLRFAHDLVNAAKISQQDRQQIIADTESVVEEAIGDASTEQERALTRGVIRTDLQSLLSSMGAPRVLEVVQDSAALKQEIQSHEIALKKLAGKDFYFKNAAYALGHFLATDESKTSLLSLNAHNIATKAGLNQTVDISLSRKLEPVIDRLVSLYALQQLPTKELSELRTYFNEQADPVKVLKDVMLLSQGLVKNAKETLFSGQPTKMQKGYIRELYDPHVSVQSAPLADETEMEAHGYKLVGKHQDIDKAHPTGMGLYYSETGGLAQYNSAAMSLTSAKSKGFEPETDKTNGDWKKLLRTAQTAEYRALSDANFITRFNQLDKGRLVPAIDSKGKIYKFRYMMEAVQKDSLLSRDTSITKVMGAMAGSIMDKPASKAQNAEVVRALKQDWNENKERKSAMYVEIGPQSSSTGHRELYRQLPEHTKQAIRKVWGDDSMHVRADVLDMIFGYRDARLSNIVKKDKEIRNAAENIAAEVFLKLLGKNTVHRLDRIQDAWEYVVKHVKDVYVIRNLNTLVGNIVSNITLLLWDGASLKDVVHDHRVAFDSLIRYQKELHELNQTKLKLSSGLLVGREDEANDRIVELETSIKNNPVTPLMDAGQFPSILEDLDEEVTYNFKPYLDKKLDEFTDKLPQPLVGVGKFLAVSKDTPIYKILYKTTQMSDFVAKYTMYTKLKREGVEEDAAQRTIRESFINYDIPSGKVLHTLNKTGLLMFTRYFLRIQKVIARLFSEKTARGILLVLADRFLGNIPSVNDSWILSRLGNPLESGAIEAIDAWDEPITMKVLLGLLD